MSQQLTLCLWRPMSQLENVKSDKVVESEKLARALGDLEVRGNECSVWGSCRQRRLNT